MNRKFSTLTVAALLVGLSLLMPSPSFATPVTGQLSITGDATVSATFLTFLCDLLSPFSCPANTGQFQVTGPVAQSGTFSSLALTYGDIHSINQTDSPVNQAFSLPGFMTFMANPDIELNLSFIYLGTGGACPPSGSAVTCTPSGIPGLMSAANPTGKSPFNLTNTASGSSASFSVSGTALRLSTMESSIFNGTFSAEFTNTPGTTDADVNHILAELGTSGAITSPYSGKFVAVATAVPEPATTFLMIGGALLFAAKSLGRRSRG
jgi:hypothetical protein